MHLPMSGWTRSRFAKMGGVDIQGKSYIGRGVRFDSMYPERNHIGNHVHVTEKVTILTKFMDTSRPDIKWEAGDVYIGSGTFIGIGTVICRPVKIGSDSVVGAGSVVTKDIPSGEIWAGNPAKFIKKRPEPETAK